MYKFSYIEKVVGFIILLSLILGIVFLMSIVKITELFRRNFEYYTILESGADITPGKKVYYKGVPIGEITKVKLTSEDKFEVRFKINEEFTNKIVEGCIFYPRSQLLGGKIFEIIPGTQSENINYLPPGSMVNSPDTYEGRIILKLRGYMSQQEEINAIIKNLSDITAYVSEYLKEDGQIDKSLKEIYSILSELKITISRINNETLPSVDMVIQERLSKTMDNLDKLIVNLNTILTEPSIRKILTNTADTTKNIAILTREISDNKQNISKTIENLQYLTENLKDLTENLKKIIR